MPVEIGAPEQASYDLRGRTLADVAAAVALQDEAAKTEWWPRFTYTTSGDLITAVDVTVKLRVTMPAWPNAKTAPDAEQRAWAQFLAALTAHEQGHVDLVNQYFADIETRLVGQSPDAAKRLWAENSTALQAASDSYDSDTDHGRKQGTVIDLTPAGSQDSP